MNEVYEVTNGGRSTLYYEHELRNAKLSACRRSRVLETVRVIDTQTGTQVAAYYGGKLIQEEES